MIYLYLSDLMRLQTQVICWQREDLIEETEESASREDSVDQNDTTYLQPDDTEESYSEHVSGKEGGLADRRHVSEENLNRTEGADPKAVQLTVMSHATSMPQILMPDAITAAPSKQNISECKWRALCVSVEWLWFFRLT